MMQQTQSEQRDTATQADATNPSQPWPQSVPPATTPEQAADTVDEQATDEAAADVARDADKGGEARYE